MLNENVIIIGLIKSPVQLPNFHWQFKWRG